jgi:hypothetical protein
MECATRTPCAANETRARLRASNSYPAGLARPGAGPDTHSLEQHISTELYHISAPAMPAVNRFIASAAKRALSSGAKVLSLLFWNLEACEEDIVCFAHA